MLKFQMSQTKELGELEFGSDWREADASPDIRISNLSKNLPDMNNFVAICIQFYS